MTTVSILGAGAWGTALALAAHRAGTKTTLWTWEERQANTISATQENPEALPGVPIPEEIKISTDLKKALKANVVLLVTPAQTIRSVAEEIKKHIHDESYLIICSKGIELETGKLLSEVLSEILPTQSISVLSGPTFAREVALGLPTAATLSSPEISSSRWLANCLSSANFRLYPSNDVIGVELSGSLKNVIAIAAGIATARGLGESARASLITRGLAEITRLGLAKGALAETFLGLSGVGDIVLSCTSTQSRNMALGLEIGKEEIVNEAALKGRTLTEGAYTAKAVMKLANELGVEMPICTAINNILYHQSPIGKEITELLARPLKAESARH